MKICGVLVLFSGAECSVSPIGDPAELTELLDAFCKHVLSDPNVSACVSGMHDPLDHRPGACAKR